MPKKGSNHDRLSLRGITSVISRVKDKGGGEKLVIRAADDKLRTVVTKRSSALAMDRAVKRYSGALKRLAKR